MDMCKREDPPFYVTRKYARALQQEKNNISAFPISPHTLFYVLYVNTTPELYCRLACFSAIVGPRDLDSGGVGRCGGDHPTDALFSSGSTSVSKLWLHSHLVATRRPSGHGCFDYSLLRRCNRRITNCSA